nr:hypothetical protein [uncultured bacterium]
MVSSAFTPGDAFDDLLLPAIIAFIEFIIYLCDSDEKFARKYG